MYRIKKTFHIAYAHRLLNYAGKCNNLHGHNALIEVTLKASELNSEKMVMDFSSLSAEVKTWLDGNLDHKTLLCTGDPLLETLKNQGQECFTVPDNPTAEILARLIFSALKKCALPVDEVTFWETPSASASYREN